MSGTGAHAANRGPAVIGVTTATIAAATIFVFLRLCSRAFIVKRISWDDYAILVAWIVCLGFSFVICYATSVGLGRHEKAVPADSEPALRKAEFAISILYNPALMSTKTSVLLFYLSLSKNDPVFRWESLITLIVVNVAGLALTLLNAFQCRPVRAAFQYPTSATAHCTDVVVLYLSSAPVNILTDMAIFFIPLPILTSMRLPRKQKIILIITFGVVAFVGVVDVIRVGFLQQAFSARLEESRTGNRLYSDDPASLTDFSWYGSYSFMWSAIEANVGLLIANVPGLKPLVFRFMPQILRDTTQDSDGTGTRSSEAQNQALAEAPAQRLPSVAEPLRRPLTGNNEQINVLDFLTTPDMASASPDVALDNPRSRTATTVTHSTKAEGATSFDFVNIKNPKSMVKMNAKESLFPVGIITIIFFLWGFAYGLLQVLNMQFQSLEGLSTGQTYGLHSIYFGAYLIGPLTLGRYTLKKWGFKVTFIGGLAIYSCGTLIFWPSAVLTSFAAFMVSNFVVGFGLSILETAANPFIALCGPPEYAEVRLNFAQGIQGIGSLVSQILAQRVFFRTATGPDSLTDAQWTYLGIALFVNLLALAIYYIPLPEVSDSDLRELAWKQQSEKPIKIGGISIVNITLALGVFSQFCLIGAQETISVSFNTFIGAMHPSPTPLSDSDYLALGHTTFAVGRFVAMGACFVIKPRWVLLFFYIGGVVTSALTMTYTGDTGIAMLILVFFFESAIFPTLFAICLRGLGARTKTAAALLTAAVCSGAIFPPVANPIAENRGPLYSFCIVVALFSFGSIFPAYLNLVPAAKKHVDPVSEDTNALFEQSWPGHREVPHQ
ncbi:MAG: hypothetical protein M1819_005072 [Sarea resinae]|nr:MAG: hypothetical protein M1819_005072 [Sarea resinae]